MKQRELTEITYKRVLELVEKFPRQLMVIGDVCQDITIEGEVKKISPEAPVPVLERKTMSITPGMAGNVAANLRELGAFPTVRTNRSAEIKKTRFKSQGQTMLRMDDDNLERRLEHAEEDLSYGLKPSDPVILSDYGKGTINRQNVHSLLMMSRYVDPDANKSTVHYHGAELITPNEQEAKRMALSLEDFFERVDDYKIKIAAVTRGAEGVALYAERRLNHIPAVPVHAIDVCGAGDTFLSAMTLSLLAGADPVEAAIVGNIAASVAVTKLGTHAVSKTEVLEASYRVLEDK